MRPECTADCDQRVTLAIAVEALVEGPCPFAPGRPFYDGLHVDNMDPECYAHEYVATSAPGQPLDWRPQCRDCINEALEERTIAAAGEHL